MFHRKRESEVALSHLVKINKNKAFECDFFSIEIQSSLLAGKRMVNRNVCFMEFKNLEVPL